MGTNYYIKVDEEQMDNPILEDIWYDKSARLVHFGKQSAGWVFTLHVYPELGIMNLDDMVELLDEVGEWQWVSGTWTSCLINEYEEVTSEMVMMDNLLSAPKHDVNRCPIDYKHCIGHGKYADYVIGNWS